jgi:peptide/nickel transport system substrate-binding protein
LIVWSVLVLACSPHPETKTSLRIAYHGDPLSLDPHFRNEVLSFSALSHIYEPLTRIDARGKVEPALAESWLNPDELRWHFILRPNVRFHDGRPLRAVDVVNSLERARRHPRSNMSSYLVEIASFQALDERTVEIRTAKPYPILLNKLAFILIAPADAPAEIVAPVGTGAYRLLSYEAKKSLLLAANRDYWRGPPAFGEVEILAVPDPEERVRLLLAGQVDVVQELRPVDTLAVEAASCCRVIANPSLQVEFLALRPTTKPFDDPRVRRALDLALDRQALVDEALGGYGIATRQLVGANVFGFDPESALPRRDLSAARRLLAEAGYSNGLDLELFARVGRPAEPIARQLAEAGFRVKARSEPWADLYNRLHQGEIDFYFGGMLAVSADASDVLDSLAHSADPTKGYGQNNYMSYSDPELDALIEESGTTLQMLERRRILQQAMRRMLDDSVYIGLYAPSKLFGLRRELEWQPRLDGFVLAHEMAPKK